MEGWPREIDGSGTPCQPRAFAPFQRRGAFREGANSFAQALSSGLQITLRTLVTSISPGEDSILVESADGEELRSRDLVLALALEQSLPFIRMLPAMPRAGRRSRASGAVHEPPVPDGHCRLSP